MKLEFETFKPGQSDEVRKAWFDHIEELVREGEELKKRDPEAWARQVKDQKKRDLQRKIDRLMND